MRLRSVATGRLDGRRHARAVAKRFGDAIRVSQGGSQADLVPAPCDAG